MSTTVVQACDSADIDANSQSCLHPFWVQQQTFLPPLDAQSGIAIGVAILACWGVAYGLRALRRVGD